VKEVEVQPIHVNPPQKLAKFIARLGLLCIAALLSSQSVFAGSAGRVFVYKNMAKARRDQLSKSLQRITGWKDLRFDDNGSLVFSGDADGGSALARDVLKKAVSGNSDFAIDDASRRSDVVFCRVVPGRWINGKHDLPVKVILIDFADFDQVFGDETALAAFNVGWGMLHELVHEVNNLDDTEVDGQIGDCEKLINQMRRECGLAERAEYFYKLHPALAESDFAPKIVRLAFDQQTASANKKKRYWIMWDARVVGGLQ
jgi:hypothetical protein